MEIIQNLQELRDEIYSKLGGTHPRDVIQLRGALRIALYDPDGKLTQERLIKNLVVTQGN